MSHGSDAATNASTRSTCVHRWCDGQFCASADRGERFHRGIFSSEGGPTESVGVDLVSNDYADGSSTGTLIDITFTEMSETGIAQHSVGLTPAAALRHAAAVAHAASLALARRR